MKTIKPLLSTIEVSDARSALYYLSRYLKQATIFEKYQKDIFEDTERSYPTEFVRKLTISLIDFIEHEQGMKASEFDLDTYSLWSDHVTEIEEGLDPEPTPEELERANTFVNAISMPVTKGQSSN